MIKWTLNENLSPYSFKIILHYRRNSSPNKILGIIFGVLTAFIFLIALMVCCLMHNRKKRSRQDDYDRYVPITLNYYTDTFKYISSITFLSLLWLKDLLLARVKQTLHCYGKMDILSVIVKEIFSATTIFF